MAGGIGRKFILEFNGVPIAGVRTKGFTVNGAEIDVTDDDSNGYRELLSEAAEISIDMPIDGLMKDDTLLIASLEHDNRIQPLTLVDPQGGIISGNFYFQNFTVGLSYKEYSTFSTSLLSSGVVTFTPGT
jgi:predicted secreted protein